MRSNTRDAVRRAFLGLMRGILVRADDSKKMQETEVRTMHGQALTGVERFQQYGHNSVPLPPDPNGQKAAEVLMGSLAGNQSLPVILVIDDRRHRPTKWQPGETGTYNHLGAKLHHQLGGTRLADGQAFSMVADAQSQHRVQAGGYVLATVADLSKFKIYDSSSSTWYQLSGFVVTTPPPADPTIA